MNEIVTSLTSVAMAIVGLAIIATLVSRNANTSGVIQAGSAGFAQDLSAAEAPVTGSSNSFGLPSLSLGGLTGLGAPMG